MMQWNSILGPGDTEEESAQILAQMEAKKQAMESGDKEAVWAVLRCSDPVLFGSQMLLMVCFALGFCCLVGWANSSYGLRSVMLACELVVVVREVGGGGASEEHGWRPFFPSCPMPDAAPPQHPPSCGWVPWWQRRSTPAQFLKWCPLGKESRP